MRLVPVVTRSVYVDRAGVPIHVPVTVGTGGHHYIETGLAHDPAGRPTPLTRDEEAAAVEAAVALLEDT